MDWLTGLFAILNRVLGWIDAAKKKEKQRERQESSDRAFDDPVDEFMSRYGVRSKDSGTGPTAAETEVQERDAK